MPENEYDQLIERLQEECAAGQSESCLQQQQPSSTDVTQTSEMIWGILVTVYVVAVVPKYLAATAQMSAGRELTWGNFYRFSLFWSLGFVFLLACWKMSVDHYAAAAFICCYLLILYGTSILVARRSRIVGLFQGLSYEMRVVASAAVLWVFLVQSWGVIFEWSRTFDSLQYLLLHILPIIGICLAYLCYRWVRGSNPK